MSGGTRLRGMMRPALLLTLLLCCVPASAWDGTESGTGNIVEIERGQTVRQGREVEFFDYGGGGYRTLDVDSIRRSGSGVEIEGTDSAGNSVTLEMDEGG